MGLTIDCARCIDVIAEVALSMAEFSENIATLASCDVDKQLSHTLGVLADVQRKAKELQDLQAREDVAIIMSTGRALLSHTYALRLIISP